MILEVHTGQKPVLTREAQAAEWRIEKSCVHHGLTLLAPLNRHRMAGVLLSVLGDNQSHQEPCLVNYLAQD